MGNCLTKKRREVIDGSNYVLCDDTLILVFSYLDLLDLFRLRRVSQQFNECIEEVLKREKYLELSVCEQECKRKILKIYEPLPIRCYRIHSLDLKDCYINEKFIGFLNETLKNLKTLSLIQCRIKSFNKFLSSYQMKTFSKKLICPKIIKN